MVSSSPLLDFFSLYWIFNCSHHVFTFQEFSYLKILFFITHFCGLMVTISSQMTMRLLIGAIFFKVFVAAVVVIVLFLTFIVLLDHLGLSLVLLFLLYV